MRCAEVQTQEPLWRRRQMRVRASPPLLLHMARCASCRRAARDGRALDAALRAALARAAAPAALRERLRVALAGRAHAPEGDRDLVVQSVPLL